MGISVKSVPFGKMDPPRVMDPASAKNLLVVVCDDMRPWFEPFSNSGVHAPNLHALAKTAMVFNNTYVQQAVCSPSRNSFMSGRRPDSTKTWNFQTSFRSAGVDTTGAQGIAWTAWPEAFKKAGYNTIGLGKVYHPQHPLDNDCLDPNAGTMAGCRSWSTTFQTNAPATVLNQLDHGAVVVNCTNNTAALQHCSFRVPSIPGFYFLLSRITEYFTNVMIILNEYYLNSRADLHQRNAKRRPRLARDVPRPS